MKDTERLRLLYQDSEAFKAGIEVGKNEVIEKACEWLKQHYAPAGFVDNIFRKAMEE